MEYQIRVKGYLGIQGLRGRPQGSLREIHAHFVRLMFIRVDQSAVVIRINPSREVRQEAGRFVGARVVDEGLGGPLWSPVGGDGIVFPQDVSQGTGRGRP